MPQVTSENYTGDKGIVNRAKYTRLNQSVHLVMSSWERGPLARRRAGRPRSQVKPYCRVLSNRAFSVAHKPAVGRGRYR